MEIQNLKNKLLNELEAISTINTNVDQITIQHGLRFINKLEKFGAITDNLSMSVLSDGNLSFEWKFEKPKHACFNIDFDKDTDKLQWCCYIDGMKDYLYGTVIHFDEIAPYLKRFLGVK